MTKTKTFCEVHGKAQNHKVWVYVFGIVCDFELFVILNFDHCDLFVIWYLWFVIYDLG